MITQDVIEVEQYIHKTWPKVRTVKPLRLSKLFPEPDNVGLKHIWKYGEADLVVFRHGLPVCIVEPGGAHHFEEHQSHNDRRKWKLAEINGVRCIHTVNGLQNRLSKRKLRQLLGGFIYGKNKSRN
jgi:hypothetical protein